MKADEQFASSEYSKSPHFIWYNNLLIYAESANIRKLQRLAKHTYFTDIRTYEAAQDGYSSRCKEINDLTQSSQAWIIGSTMNILLV
jgi:hypothetical protein